MSIFLMIYLFFWNSLFLTVQENLEVDKKAGENDKI